ncbi:MAG: TadE/TadG family type IV pilus assembly protein [Pirellulales bacterium]
MNRSSKRSPQQTRRGCYSTKRPKRWGVAATEFAIVAPVFLLLVIGMVELGRALMVQQVLINASRVGARQAITLGATTTTVQTAVKDYAASVAVPGVTVAVTPSPSAAKAGDPITVTTSVAYNGVSWLPSPWFLGGANLHASSRMRKEGFE